MLRLVALMNNHFHLKLSCTVCIYKTTAACAATSQHPGYALWAAARVSDVCTLSIRGEWLTFSRQSVCEARAIGGAAQGTVCEARATAGTASRGCAAGSAPCPRPATAACPVTGAGGRESASCRGCAACRRTNQRVKSTNWIILTSRQEGSVDMPCCLRVHSWSFRWVAAVHDQLTGCKVAASVSSRSTCIDACYPKLRCAGMRDHWMRNKWR